MFVLFGSVAQTGLPRAEVLVKPSTSAVSSDPSSNTSGGSSPAASSGMPPLPIIGGAVGGVVLIAAACCCLRWRRKHDSQKFHHDVEVSNETHTNAQMHSNTRISSHFQCLLLKTVSRQQRAHGNANRPETLCLIERLVCGKKMRGNSP